MTLEELVITIKTIASQKGASADNSPLLDSITLVESILPRVLDVVTNDVCKDAQQLQTLRADHTIAFTGGVGTLPATVKEEFIETAYAYTASASTNVGDWASYKRDLIDYGQGGSNIFPSFSVQNGDIYYRKAGELATAYTGNIVFNAVTLPTLSGVSGIKDNILEQIIALAVSVVIGEVPLGKIGLDFTSFAQEGKSA